MSKADNKELTTKLRMPLCYSSRRELCELGGIVQCREGKIQALLARILQFPRA